MKYICLDIGNVICSLHFDEFLEVLSTNANISIEEANRYLLYSQKKHDLGMTLVEDDLRYKFKVPSDNKIKDLMDCWNNTVRANSIVISWVENLISKNVQTALLSNMGLEHRKIVDNILGKKIYVSSRHFFSCDVGNRKPTIIYYKTFLDLHPNFNNCVYLDDNEDNIKVGNSFGLKSILFDISKIDKKDLPLRLKEIEELI